MHFAMPPRKTSRPPPYAARPSRGFTIPYALRGRRRMLLVALLGFATFWWLLGVVGIRSSGRGGRGVPGIPSPSIIGTGPEVVVVTVMPHDADERWAEKIRENREAYAKKHGYLAFFPTNTQYPLHTPNRQHPPSWAKVPALRHAMTLHPSSRFFWYLDASALIMNFDIPLTSHVLEKATLEKLMIANQPVVPPDSVIKTFANLRGDRIDLVITQDKEGLSTSSMVVRNGDWAKYFLDAWFDPIYRNYNFQKADTHALEHIVQWHGTLLAKLALIPQNLINSYASGNAAPNGGYKEGDLVASFPGCDKDKRSCAEEQATLLGILEGKMSGDD